MRAPTFYDVDEIDAVEPLQVRVEALSVLVNELAQAQASGEASDFE